MTRRPARGCASLSRLASCRRVTWTKGAYLKSSLNSCADTTSVISSREWGSGRLPSDGQTGPVTDQSGPAPALASRGVVPGRAGAMQTSAIYGPLFENSYSHVDLPLFSESKSPAPQLSERLGEALKLRLSRYGSMEYGQTWKLRVTPLGLRYWAHTASGRRTSGSGCTGSRTPTAGDAQRGVEKNPKARNPKAGTASLNNEAALAGHPTPNTPSGGPNSNRENRNAGGADLEEVAKLAGHPTCSARDWKDTPGMAQTGTNPDGTERSRLDMLPRVAALAGLGATTESTDTSMAKTAGYRLNPGFSLWLMIGIPTIVDAWASCGVRAMQSCRSLRKSS